MKRVRCCVVCILAASIAAGCNAPVDPAATGQANQNSNADNRRGDSPPARNAPPAANANLASGGMMGEPIDTSGFDAEIGRLEAQANKGKADQAARQALAAAYLKRANALLEARQYRVALGDYRRVLKYDPENAEAKKWSAQIVQIMQSMNREVPVPGAEPTPLPFKA